MSRRLEIGMFVNGKALRQPGSCARLIQLIVRRHVTRQGFLS